EEREMPFEASARGASEVSAAIVASTVTTIVIFLPIVFIRGVSGQLFRELAYVVSFSLICSLFVSLSLVPMLSSKLLKAHSGSDKGPAARATWTSRLAATAEGAFRGLEQRYGRILRTGLRHRHATIGTAVLLLAASVVLAPRIGTELMP